MSKCLMCIERHSALAVSLASPSLIKSLHSSWEADELRSNENAQIPSDCAAFYSNKVLIFPCFQGERVSYSGVETIGPEQKSKRYKAE